MLEHNQLNIFDFIDMSGKLLKNNDIMMFEFSIVEVDSKGNMLTEDRIIEGELVKGLTKNHIKFECDKKELIKLVSKSLRFNRCKFAYNFYFEKDNKDWVGSIRFWNMKTKSNETIYEFIYRGINHVMSKWDGISIIYL